MTNIDEVRMLRYHAEKVIQLCCKLEREASGSALPEKPHKAKKQVLTDQQKFDLINRRKLKRLTNP